MRESMSMVTAGMVLGAGIVMAVVLFAGQQAQAHTQSLPSCSGLPTADGFFDSVTFDATAVTTTTTKPGTGERSEGSERHRYAKITVPQLAAGELRLFSSVTPSDAVLCYGSRERARYKTSYKANHDREERAARAARTAANKAAADEIAARTTAPPGETADQAERRLRNQETAVRNILSRVASALTAVARALTTADPDTADDGDGITAANVTDAQNAATAAQNARQDKGTTDDDSPTDEITALTGADGAVAALRTAAGVLEAAAIVVDPHTGKGFKLRAEVKSGEGEYILVTVQPDPATEPTAPADPAPTIAFHGVHSSTPPGGIIPKEGDSGFHALTVTAPGLLTISATGSGNLRGELQGVPNAQAGGSGSTFTLAVPVLAADTPTLAVRSQSRSSINYDLTASFAAAMSTTTSITGITVVDAPTWAGTVIDNDDVPVQIARRSEDGNQADQDVFVFSLTSSGLLAVNGDKGSSPSAKTKGVLYGPLGEIDADTNSGPGGEHFGFANIPVQSGNRYAIVVNGADTQTEGSYLVTFDLDTITGTVSDGTENFAAATIAETPDDQQKKNRTRYLFNIVHRGTLYLEAIS